eukprot:GHVN01089461.1.p1 GENE.GHVN01089461.1~~GHVN01089461.1.p1  ORF type:complete len:1433 (+),score=267.82 GHVN01089461.1:1146-5444(+)
MRMIVLDRIALCSCCPDECRYVEQRPPQDPIKDVFSPVFSVNVRPSTSSTSVPIYNEPSRLFEQPHNRGPTRKPAKPRRPSNAATRSEETSTQADHGQEPGNARPVVHDPHADCSDRIPIGPGGGKDNTTIKETEVPKPPDKTEPKGKQREKATSNNIKETENEPGGSPGMATNPSCLRCDGNASDAPKGAAGSQVPNQEPAIKERVELKSPAKTKPKVKQEEKGTSDRIMEPENEPGGSTDQLDRSSHLPFDDDALDPPTGAAGSQVPKQERKATSDKEMEVLKPPAGTKPNVNKYKPANGTSFRENALENGSGGSPDTSSRSACADNPVESPSDGLVHSDDAPNASSECVLSPAPDDIKHDFNQVCGDCGGVIPFEGCVCPLKDTLKKVMARIDLLNSQLNAKAGLHVPVSRVYTSNFVTDRQLNANTTSFIFTDCETQTEPHRTSSPQFLTSSHEPQSQSSTQETQTESCLADAPVDQCSTQETQTESCLVGVPPDQRNPSRGGTELIEPSRANILTHSASQTDQLHHVDQSSMTNLEPLSHAPRLVREGITLAPQPNATLSTTSHTHANLTGATCLSLSSNTQACITDSIQIDTDMAVRDNIIRQRPTLSVSLHTHASSGMYPVNVDGISVEAQTDLPISQIQFCNVSGEEVVTTHISTQAEFEGGGDAPYSSQSAPQLLRDTCPKTVDAHTHMSDDELDARGEKGERDGSGETRGIVSPEKHDGAAQTLQSFVYGAQNSVVGHLAQQDPHDEYFDPTASTVMGLLSGDGIPFDMVLENGESGDERGETADHHPTPPRTHHNSTDQLGETAGQHHTPPRTHHHTTSQPHHSPLQPATEGWKPPQVQDVVALHITSGSTRRPPPSGEVLPVHSGFWYRSPFTFPSSYYIPSPYVNTFIYCDFRVTREDDGLHHSAKPQETVDSGGSVAQLNRYDTPDFGGEPEPDLDSHVDTHQVIPDEGELLRSILPFEPIMVDVDDPCDSLEEPSESVSPNFPTSPPSPRSPCSPHFGSSNASASPLKPEVLDDTVAMVDNKNQEVKEVGENGDVALMAINSRNSLTLSESEMFTSVNSWTEAAIELVAMSRATEVAEGLEASEGAHGTEDFLFSQADTVGVEGKKVDEDESEKTGCDPGQGRTGEGQLKFQTDGASDATGVSPALTSSSEPRRATSTGRSTPVMSEIEDGTLIETLKFAYFQDEESQESDADLGASDGDDNLIQLPRSFTVERDLLISGPASPSYQRMASAPLIKPGSGRGYTNGEESHENQLKRTSSTPSQVKPPKPGADLTSSLSAVFSQLNNQSQSSTAPLRTVSRSDSLRLISGDRPNTHFQGILWDKKVRGWVAYWRKEGEYKYRVFATHKFQGPVDEQIKKALQAAKIFQKKVSVSSGVAALMNQANPKELPPEVGENEGPMPATLKDLIEMSKPTPAPP